VIDSFDKEYSFLSNFYHKNFIHKNMICKTSEHIFQAAKAMHVDEFVPILNTETPGKAKRMGSKVELRSDWEEVKIQVMESIINSKFKDIDLRQKLLDTEDEELIEGNYWHDRFWGVCKCDSCGNEGRNELGKILMKERKKIKELQV